MFHAGKKLQKGGNYVQNGVTKQRPPRSDTCPTSSVHPEALMESLEPLLEGELQEAFGSGVLMPLI